MSKIPHQQAADNYIIEMGTRRTPDEVKAVVEEAEGLVTPGDELTVVHLKAVEGFMFSQEN